MVNIVEIKTKNQMEILRYSLKNPSCSDRLTLEDWKEFPYFRIEDGNITKAFRNSREMTVDQWNNVISLSSYLTEIKCTVPDEKPVETIFVKWGEKTFSNSGISPGGGRSTLSVAEARNRADKLRAEAKVITADCKRWEAYAARFGWKESSL